MTEHSHILPEHDVRPYSIAQLADRWGCSDSMIRKLINQGRLQFFRIGMLIRIPAAVVQRYEEAVAASEPVTLPDQVSASATAVTPARVIPRAPRRRKPMVIDKSKVCPPPRKRPKVDP